jgi:DNA polymerase epsilon subunit 1
MIGQFLSLNEFVEDRIQTCRYSDVPICNIENDFLAFLSDIFLSRRLQKADMILWCSASSKPDLGGSEQIDNIISLGTLKYSEVNVSGTYNNVCIEMEVWDLALNTFIQMSQQTEWDSMMSGSTGKGLIHLIDPHLSTQDSNTTLNLNNGSNDSLHQVLGIIRQMVKQWLAEVRDDKGLVFLIIGPYASYFLGYFHRWITSTTAYFYDPMIVQHIHNLMKRSFGCLLDELKRFL